MTQGHDGKKKSHDNSSYFYQLLLQTTLKHLRHLINNYLPVGHQADYLLWLLADDNIYREDYLQATGVNKTTELMVSLLAEIVEKHGIDLEKLTHYLGALNAYLFYEVVSDNLAIGLAVPQQQDLTYQLRQQVLLDFNNIAEQKLAGNPTPALNLLAPLVTKINSISSYKQSLGSHALQRFTQCYVSQRPQIAIDELEYDELVQLALNIESCVRLNQLMEAHPIASELTSSLIDRYAAVNNLLRLNNEDIDLLKLADYGTKTILVVPTLLFVIGALDSCQPNSRLPDVINNRLLINALEKAACLVRLLNDIGTQLLLGSEAHRMQFCERLLQIYHEQSSCQKSNTILEFLEKIAETDEFFKAFTRIRKDIKYGEFNLCLHNLKKSSDTHAAIDQFFNNVQFYAQLYQRQRNELTQLLATINNYLHCDKASHAILRFVVFHEKIYACEFESSQGEYAIPASDDMSHSAI